MSCRAVAGEEVENGICRRVVDLADLRVVGSDRRKIDEEVQRGLPKGLLEVKGAELAVRCEAGKVEG